MPTNHHCFQAPDGALFLVDQGSLTILGSHGADQVTLSLSDLEAWLRHQATYAASPATPQSTVAAATLSPPDEPQESP